MKAFSALTFGLLLAACLAPAIEASSFTGELVMSEARAQGFLACLAGASPNSLERCTHACICARICGMCVHEQAHHKV